MNKGGICILGGTGFVGSLLASRLAVAGYQVKVLTRHQYRHKQLLLIPRLTLHECDVYDPIALQSMMRGSAAVINLVGILNSQGQYSFERVHTDLVRVLADACVKTGVRRLLHMSALNADPAAASAYLRSKGVTEAYLLGEMSEQLDVTCFRPSVIFGPDDSFVNRFAALVKLTRGIFPLACADSRFAPVFVGDVVDAMIRRLENAEDIGQAINLCGPEIYTLGELVSFVAAQMEQPCRVLPMPDWAAKMQARVLERLPGKAFTMDNYQSLQVDSICPEGTATCKTTLSAVVPGYLGKNSKAARLQQLRESQPR